MAYDPGLAELMREATRDLAISEKKMFGGICFLLHGHMLCGIHKNGAMFRVGKDNDANARAIPGVKDMMFTGRPMSGMVDASEETIANEDHLARLIALARGYVETLPPK